MAPPRTSLAKRAEARLRGWIGDTPVDLARGLVHRFRASRVPVLAAALAYYAAFSLGPLLLLLAGWLAIVLRTQPELGIQYREALVALLEQVLPLQVDSVDLVDRSFTLIVDQLSQGALLRTVVSLVILVWAASNFFTSLQLALEMIFDVREGRGFWRKRLVGVVSVVAVATVVLVEVVGGLVMSSVARISELAVDQLARFNIAPPSGPEFGGGLTLDVLRIAIAFGAFTLAFRWLPRRGSDWLGAAVGGAFSTAGILIMRQVLLTIFDPERFNLIYGVVTGLLAVLMWLYLALLFVLLGALLAAEISALRRRRARREPPARGDPDARVGA